MLTKNKFGAYLAYAAGEIILVIVGILIALTINEHSNNENKLELRNSYILQLNDEADHNLQKLTILNDQANQMLKELNTMFQILLKKEYDNPQLATKSFYLIISKKFYPVMITFENLKFSGGEGTVNDMLRNHLRNIQPHRKT